jgi:GntR family transcriptional regulator of arabinose operon
MNKTLKYLKVYVYYKNLINSGILQPGQKLHTESEIEDMFKVSKITVRKALSKLEHESLIERVQGSGSFVKNNKSKDSSLKLISLIIPFNGQGREIGLIEGIEKELGNLGYSFIINNSGNSCVKEMELIKNIKTKVKGIILYPALHGNNTNIYMEALKEKYPIVYIDRYPSELPCSYVVSDNFTGGYEIGNYLINKGHNNFILIFNDVNKLTSERDRFNGFMKAIQNSGISKDNISILSMEPEEEIDLVDEYALNKLENVVSSNGKISIFTCNDITAYRIMEKIMNKGIHNNNNFIIAGFDDLYTKPLTLPFVTIRQDHYKIGQAAANMIIKMIESNSCSNENIVIPIQLVEKYPSL